MVKLKIEITVNQEIEEIASPLRGNKKIVMMIDKDQSVPPYNLDHLIYGEHKEAEV